MSREIAESFGCRIVRATLVGLLLLLPISAARADVVSDNPDGEVQEDNTPRLYFEPIAGLTTIRHLAPLETAIPLGTILELYLSMPEDAVVTFTGAAITSRTPDGVSALCPLDRVGTVLVAAVVELSDGTRRVFPSRLTVLPIAIADISATMLTPTVAPFDLNESATNAETMAYFFGKSIARLVETTVGAMDANSDDGRRRRPVVGPVTRSFRTSIDRPIEFLVEADPQGFTPLMEWRVDGQGISIGAVREDRFMTVGSHTVSVGPPARSTEVRIDTYSVSITSHRDQVDLVRDRERITFEAVTDPPGNEEYITWLSSTKYGTAVPVLGQGPTFTAEFNDTYGPHPDGGSWQWLGVRADNAIFGQDQKSFPMAGTDIIEHDLQIGFDMGDDGTIDEVFLFNGVMEIQRCDPFTNAQGFRQIDFLVTDWFAVASSDILEAEIVYVISDGVTQDVSTIISQFDNRDFPARFKFNVIFDVFVDGILEFSQHHGMPQGDDFLVVPPNGDRSESPTMTTFEEETIFFNHPVLGPLRFVPIDCNDQNSSTVAGVPPNCPAP